MLASLALAVAGCGGGKRLDAARSALALIRENHDRCATFSGELTARWLARYSASLEAGPYPSRGGPSYPEMRVQVQREVETELAGTVAEAQVALLQIQNLVAASRANTKWHRALLQVYEAHSDFCGNALAQAGSNFVGTEERVRLLLQVYNSAMAAAALEMPLSLEDQTLFAAPYQAPIREAGQAAEAAIEEERERMRLAARTEAERQAEMQRRQYEADVAQREAEAEQARVAAERQAWADRLDQADRARFLAEARAATQRAERERLALEAENRRRREEVRRQNAIRVQAWGEGFERCLRPVESLMAMIRAAMRGPGLSSARADCQRLLDAALGLDLGCIDSPEVSLGWLADAAVDLYGEGAQLCVEGSLVQATARWDDADVTLRKLRERLMAYKVIASRPPT